jgi:hypothetical protein
MNKYETLSKDLKEAVEEAIKSKIGDDGGTANKDATFLTLKGWREEKVLEAIKDAGLYCRHKTQWIGTGYLINTAGGQGNDRTRVRDRVKQVLKDKGYDVLVFNKMD